MKTYLFNAISLEYGFESTTSEDISVILPLLAFWSCWICSIKLCFSSTVNFDRRLLIWSILYHFWCKNLWKWKFLFQWHVSVFVLVREVSRSQCHFIVSVVFLLLCFLKYLVDHQISRSTLNMSKRIYQLEYLWK